MSVRVNINRKDMHHAFDDILNRRWFSEGKYRDLFEQECCVYGYLNPVAVSSGGAALYIAYQALKSKKVLVPNNTFMASAEMAVQATGASIVLADCGEDLSMSYTDVLQGLTDHPDIDTICLVHIGGGIAKDTLAIANLCRSRGVRLLEDAAHAVGAKDLDGNVAGTWGDIATFSMCPTKAVPAGEAGFITSKDSSLALKCSDLRGYCKSVVEGVMDYRGGGSNLRLDEWTSVVAWLQMRRLPDIIDLRARAAERLSRVVEPAVSWGGVANNYKYIVTKDFHTIKKAGMVYSVEDQLSNSMRLGGTFPKSVEAAANLVALPIGEGMYEGLSTGDIEALLLGRTAC